MVQLTQVFVIYTLCAAVVKCHVLFGNNHRQVNHDISELPQIISHFITQHIGYPHAHGYPQLYNYGLNRPGVQGGGNMNMGSSPYDMNYNRPANIFGGNFFGSPDYTSQEGPFSSEESGEPQKPSSGEEVPNIQTGQVPPISDGMNGEVFDGNIQDPSNVNGVANVPNEQNVDLTGQANANSINGNVPNIQVPHEENNTGNHNDFINGVDASIMVGGPAGTNADMNNSGAATNTVSPVVGQLGQVGSPNSIGPVVGQSGEITSPNNAGPVVGQLGQVVSPNNAGSVVGQLGEIGSPNSVSVTENIEGNKHHIGSDAAIADQDNAKLKLNSSSDSISNSSLHVNAPMDDTTSTEAPVVKIILDPTLQSIVNDIFSPDDRSILNIGIDEPKVSASGNSSQNISNSEIKVPDVPTSTDENLKQNVSLTAPVLANNSTLVVKEDKDQDGKLKTNQVVQSANDDSDIAISKHKERTSIIFPDQLNEARDKIQKQKNESHLSKLNDINGVDNGQILYAVNIGPSIAPSNQGFYVSPTSTDNGQQVYVNSPSGTPAQYVSQNPSSTVSNTVPSDSVVSTNTNGVSPSGGYTMVNVPANENSHSGQATYNYPTSSTNQPNNYYQVPNNPTQQAYYTVQLSNGQIALVPVSNGQYVQTNGQGQIVVPNNGQQYVMSNGQPVQSTGQIVYSNGQQYVPVNGQPIQGNGQFVMSSNGQQYVPSNGQHMQGNGQVMMTNNGQQYIPISSQPTQGNGQFLVSSNGQQYIQASAQPTQGNGQIVVQGNPQYMQSNGQPTNGQYIMSSNGQNYVPSGQVNVPWSQGTVQNNGQVYIPLNNQNSQSNVVTVPSGSLVSVGGSVPLMVFKDKDESAPKPALSSDDEDDDKIDEDKDEIKDDIKENAKVIIKGIKKDKTVEDKVKI